VTTDQSRRRLLKLLAVSVVSVPAVATNTAYAGKAKPPIYTPRFSDKALEGYDAVSYFTHSAPQKGQKKYSTKHSGATWLFSSAQNRDDFVADPQKFMPQFGGYCAFSVAKGKLIKGDATLYALVDDKLYINYNKGIHIRWLKSKLDMIDKAQGNWPTILG